MARRSRRKPKLEMRSCLLQDYDTPMYPVGGTIDNNTGRSFVNPFFDTTEFYAGWDYQLVVIQETLGEGEWIYWSGMDMPLGAREFP